MTRSPRSSKPRKIRPATSAAAAELIDQIAGDMEVLITCLDGGDNTTAQAIAYAVAGKCQNFIAPFLANQEEP